MTHTWIRAAEERAGPLGPPARLFLEHWHEENSGETKGPEGIGWLARCVDDFAKCGEDEDSFLFVETAGAFLGLLLLDYFPDSAHYEHEGKHRIRLGTYGCFDPFSAISHAIEAQEPRKTLSERLALAEREVHGRGPVSRVVVAFEHALEAHGANQKISDCVELQVTLSDGTELELSSLERATRDGDSKTLERACTQYVNMLSGLSDRSATLWIEVAEQVFPRIVPEDFLITVGAASSPKESVLPREESKTLRPGEVETGDARDTRGRRLVHTPLDGNLSVCYGLRDQGRFRYIREEELERWNQTRATLHQRAVLNLTESTGALALHDEQWEGQPLVVLRTGDGLDSARLIVDQVRRAVADYLDDDTPCFAIPHRDTLLACASGHKTHREALRRFAADAYERAPHRISPSIFVFPHSRRSRSEQV